MSGSDAAGGCEAVGRRPLMPAGLEEIRAAGGIATGEVPHRSYQVDDRP